MLPMGCVFHRTIREEQCGIRHLHFRLRMAVLDQWSHRPVTMLREPVFNSNPCLVFADPVVLQPEEWLVMDLSGFYPPANPKPGSSTGSPVAGAAGMAAAASAPPVAEDAPPPYTTLPRSPSEAGASPWIGASLVVFPSAIHSQNEEFSALRSESFPPPLPHCTADTETHRHRQTDRQTHTHTHTHTYTAIPLTGRWCRMISMLQAFLFFTASVSSVFFGKLQAFIPPKARIMCLCISTFFLPNDENSIVSGLVPGLGKLPWVAEGNF